MKVWMLAVLGWISASASATAPDGPMPTISFPLIPMDDDTFGVQIQLGNPPQTLLLQVDTNSADVWASSSAIRSGGKGFAPSNSTTYVDDRDSAELEYFTLSSESVSVTVEVSNDQMSILTSNNNYLDQVNVTFGVAFQEDAFFSNTLYDGIFGAALNGKAVLTDTTPINWLIAAAGTRSMFSIYIPPVEAMGDDDANADPLFYIGGYNPIHFFSPQRAPFLMQLLQHGQPAQPPAGFDVWRLQVISVFVRCMRGKSGCLDVMDVGKTDASGRIGAPTLGAMDLCEGANCVAVLASGMPHIGLPPLQYTRMVTAINSSCSGRCYATNATNIVGAQAKVNGQSILCPLSCDLAAFPNITFRLATGNDGTTGPLFVDFPLSAIDFVTVVNLSPNQPMYRVHLTDFTESYAGEADILLGVPFLRAYYTTFDLGNKRVIMGSTRSIQPLPAPFGPGGAFNFWGSTTMWGVVIGSIVFSVCAFGCYVIVRDRVREARSRENSRELQRKLLGEGRNRDDSLLSLRTGADERRYTMDSDGCDVRP